MALKAELARWVEDGITPEELDRARRALLAASQSRRANDSALAVAWVAKLDLGRTFADDAELEARLQALDADTVNAALRRWIDPYRVNWAMAGDFAP